jgi:methylated-DNA-[protein]-cysteine S-methyltransferase
MRGTEQFDTSSTAIPADAIVDGLLHQAHARIERELAIIRRPEVAIGAFASPLGRLLIAEGPRGLVMVHYMDGGGAQERIEALRRKFDPIKDARAVEPVVREIRGLLNGNAAALTRKVDLSLVDSPFRRDVLKRLCEVPRGAVVSYQALAAATGAPNAQRAIGTTMATNPIPVYVPCHRVVKSDGTVGNYGGGPSIKIKLLRAEGFAIDSHNRLTAVWGHRDTKIFCRPECSAAQRANRLKQVMFADSARAQQAGMRPCKLCQPAR